MTKACECGVQVEWREVETDYGIKNKSFNPDGSEHWPTCTKRDEILARLRAKREGQGGGNNGAMYNKLRDMQDKLADLEARIILLEAATGQASTTDNTQDLPF